jgi:hypothetical protein
MDLMDALASQQGVGSVVALSESPLFRRGHASVGRAIGALRGKAEPGSDSAQEAWERRLRQPIGPLLQRPAEGEPWVLSVDSTPLARPHAATLEDRGWTHEAQPVPGRPPVTIGHEYSLACVLPERARGEPVWALPVAARRVATVTSAQVVAAEQIQALLTDPQLPMAGQRTVALADSHYSQATFLAPLAAWPDLTTITRLRKNRVLFEQPPAPEPGMPGRRRIYGAKLRPGTIDSLTRTDDIAEVHALFGVTRRRVTLYRWNDLILKGESGGHAARQIADVVVATVFGEDGRPCYRQDMTLAIVGDRRREIGLEQAFTYYRRRFDQEHSHRFLRRNLLMDAYQSPLTEHEEAWMDLVVLAFQTLFAGRALVDSVRRPWEPKPKTIPEADPALAPSLGPSHVQRGIARVFAQFGTPARPSKPRGIPSGWSPNTPRDRRQVLPVVKRGPPSPRKRLKTA